MSIGILMTTHYVRTQDWGLRTTDGKRVVIKAVMRRSRELDIIQFLSSPSARSHSMNHCIPVLDIIEDDEIAFIVMEQWLAGFMDLPIRVGAIFEYSSLVANLPKRDLPGGKN
ncbi:hypothetical protein MPER_09647 [Moniliophthora perniciosa FA553]|nr:hypothetical protein MPER_09647 [Moniliophthora perniciosa FA553]